MFVKAGEEMEKNQEIELIITGTTADGQGVGKYEGMAVFVPFAAEGDILRVKIVKVLKSYCYGIIMDIISPSPNRNPEDCGVFGKCGGCVYRHINYEAECSVKYDRVADALKRLGGIDIVPQPIIPAISAYEYRNKAQYPVGVNREGRPVIGFYAQRSHRIVENMDCRLHPKIFNDVLEAAKQWIEYTKVSIYDEQSLTGLLRHIYIRMAKATGEIMVVIVINGDSLPESEMLVELLKKAVGESLKSVQININKKNTNVILGDECKTLYGEDYIIDILCGVRIRVSPLSFYQVNRDMAEILYQKVAEYAQPEGKVVLDLYCGTGSIGLSMAKSAKQIIGVEIVEQAVEDARINARINGIENAKFLAADAAEAVRMLWEEGIKPDVIVVDPPRKGCSPELLNIIADSFTPETFVYVSCDPATLARDLKLMEQMGYKTQSVTPIDLFPRTAHVECVVLMTNVKNK